MAASPMRADAAVVDAIAETSEASFAGWSLPAAEERRIVRAARAGSNEARTKLVERYGDIAWRTAYVLARRQREAAEDAVQEAFIRAFATLDRFDDTRPFQPWLLRIVANVALGCARRDGRRADIVRERVAPFADAAAVAGPGPIDDDLRRAVTSLEPGLRSIVFLRFFADLTPVEIAGVLDVPVGTVHSRTHRAMGLLRAALQGDGAPLAQRAGIC